MQANRLYGRNFFCEGRIRCIESLEVMGSPT
jgi:hypothetical protein